MIRGFATSEGTARYRDRFPRARDAGHFRRPDISPASGAEDSGPGDLWLSSIGLGTYLGDPTPEVDRSYTEAALAAMRGGINVLDAAINYRHQRSERNLGAALKQLVESGELSRDEILVCTKAGYLSFDGDMPGDPRAYLMREYIERGIVDPAELAGGMHCMSPNYLHNQLERSRANLGLETIDVFYVHNPESQLSSVAPDVFEERLRRAFQALEESVKAGKIRYYGTATWNAYRVPPAQPGYMSLERVVTIAREAGGSRHHFRFVQLPFNLGMPEAYGLRNQRLNGDQLPLLEAARRLGVAVVGSATLHQGALAAGLPEFITKRLGMPKDWENAIQFARSAPGVVTALVGMSDPRHVRANLAVATCPPAPLDDWKTLFQR